jgi:hypothetical protein
VQRQGHAKPPEALKTVASCVGFAAALQLLLQVMHKCNMLLKPHAGLITSPMGLTWFRLHTQAQQLGYAHVQPV